MPPFEQAASRRDAGGEQVVARLEKSHDLFWWFAAAAGA
jgi:hypothetical protein